MIADQLVGLPSWVLTVLDSLMILGAMGGLCWIGERVIDMVAPANPRPPAQPMRTASAKQIERDVAQLWGGATATTKVRAGSQQPQQLRPSYPKQPVAGAGHGAQRPVPTPRAAQNPPSTP